MMKFLKWIILIVSFASTEPQKTSPCVPSPCGPNSQCREYNDQAICSCLPSFAGAPPECRPQCETNAECAQNKECINQRCQDRIPEQQNSSPCVPSPCGPNSQCREYNKDQAICSCLPSYVGSPPQCRPQCVTSSECAQNKKCINQRCQDPCTGACGTRARCVINHHTPICSCPPSYTGNPHIRCDRIPEPVENDPCTPSPCGPNSQCRVNNNQAECACLAGYAGKPPICKAECVADSECNLNEVCINRKCIHQCPGACGIDAICHVGKHSSIICSCKPGYTGDPFSHCEVIVESTPHEPSNPCSPSPCGPNSICTVNGEIPSCSCLPEYIGSPPNCLPQCTSNRECPDNLACINQICRNPCPEACALNAECRVINHTAICNCTSGYTGDPLVQCDLLKTN